MEEMQELSNFVKAERLLGKNKPDNPVAQHISKNPEKYAKRLLEKVGSGNYKWHKPRETTIVDNYKGKERGLKIPCLEDQAVQLAWLNIAIPYIERRNYYYNCGSIPGAGQSRCTEYVKKCLRNKRNKYGAVTDIRKFYDTCPHSAIRKGLKRIFKDKAFVEFAMGFVATMSDTDVGIAIGYPSSHWLANVALMEMDHYMRRNFPHVTYTRYMDDIAMTSSNKRELKKAVMAVKGIIESLGMHLKKWVVFKIKGRGLTFLSYRFFNGYTLLTKKLMVRISRRMKKANKKLTRHAAAGVMSYMGILEQCDSFNFRKEHVYPYVKRRDCTKIISLWGKAA